MSFRQVHSADWLAYFVAAGHPDVRPLAAGVEGAVYELGDGTAAKVWGRRRPDELRLWQAFYADLAAAGLPFATPEILRVEEIRGVAVTVERQLSGTPLHARVDLHADQLEPSVADTMLGILRALAAVPATPAMRHLPVLDETRPFRAPGDDFPAAMVALLERRPLRLVRPPAQRPRDHRRPRPLSAASAARRKPRRRGLG